MNTRSTFFNSITSTNFHNNSENPTKPAKAHKKDSNFRVIIFQQKYFNLYVK